MKYLLFVLGILFSTLVFGQDFQGSMKDQPDGITIYYFNTPKDTCLPKLFIGDNMQIIFPCYSKQKYDRKDISKATVQIHAIKAIVTFDFIEKLLDCCDKKGCGDTMNGYYIMLKNGDKNKFIFIDSAFVIPNKCGTEELDELLTLFNKIISE